MELWPALTNPRRLFLIAGPCAIESETLCLRIAESLKRTCSKLGVTYIFKASFDKANRSTQKSFRGPGLAGVATLQKVRQEIGVPVLTDIHDPGTVDYVASRVDVLQIPALLCRQTDLIRAAARTGKIVNIKKGQFLCPYEIGNAVGKALYAGGERVLLTERGTSFGYNNLIVDMRSIPIMRQLGFPVVFDATHSVQLPGGLGDRSGGQREFAPVLARAAVAAGANGVFIETHPQPDKALSDGPNMIPLADMPKLIASLLKVHAAVR